MNGPKLCTEFDTNIISSVSFYLSFSTEEKKRIFEEILFAILSEVSLSMPMQCEEIMTRAHLEDYEPFELGFVTLSNEKIKKIKTQEEWNGKRKNKTRSPLSP